MDQLNSGGALKGFSILQPAIGAPLSWMPVMGSKELDQLINAYLPGPASLQEKRTTISMDFFAYSAQTGESFKYYPVDETTASASSPSSAFSASPAMSDRSHASPASSRTTSTTKKSSSASAASKKEPTDFSSLPGMKILTMDGQDVTNTVSRGCKTKEQREHAHLMRVLKACDACKRKKIRCDPSHKRRSGSSASSPSSSQGKQQASRSTTAVSKPAAKKARIQQSSSPPKQAAQRITTTATLDNLSFDLDLDTAVLPALDQSWDEFLTFHDEPATTALPHQDFYGAVPQDFDFFFLGSGHETTSYNNNSNFSPAVSGSSGSFDSPTQPLTPVGLSQREFTGFTEDFGFLNQHEPALPYMAPGSTHGGNYVDFNLYSPATSFIDEEPTKLKAGDKKRKASATLQDTANTTASSSSSSSPNSSPMSSTPASSISSPSSGFSPEQQWCFVPSTTTAASSIGGISSISSISSQFGHERAINGSPHQQRGDLTGGLASAGSQAPFHADNAGCGSSRRPASASPVSAVQSSVGQQVVSPRQPQPSSGLPVVRQEVTPVAGHTAPSGGLMPQTVNMTELQVVNTGRTPVQQSVATTVLTAGLQLPLTAASHGHRPVLPGVTDVLIVRDGAFATTAAGLLATEPLVPARNLRRAGLLQQQPKQQRQVLQGKPISTATRLSVTPTSPVRQLPGCNKASQRVVFGLVSAMLLLLLSLVTLLPNLLGITTSSLLALYRNSIHALSLTTTTAVFLSPLLSQHSVRRGGSLLSSSSASLRRRQQQQGLWASARRGLSMVSCF